MASAEFVTLDPEFEELLREVASDPDSSLLRVPRPKRVRSLFDRGAPVGNLEAGLSTAERHLLQVHRNELAWLLRQACLLKLVEGPRNRLYVTRYIAADREVRLIRPRRMRRLAERHQAESRHFPEGVDACALLDRCVEDPLGNEPDVGALAAASFRLQRTDDARIMAAMELAYGSGQRAALEILHDVLSTDPMPNTWPSVWSHVGVAYSGLLEFEKARIAFKRVCTIDDCSPIAWLSRLALDMQLGDLQDIAVVEDWQSNSRHDVHASVRHFADSILHLRILGRWKPTRAALTHCAELSNNYCGMIAEVASVFQ